MPNQPKHSFHLSSRNLRRRRLIGRILRMKVRQPLRKHSPRIAQQPMKSQEIFRPMGKLQMLQPMKRKINLHQRSVLECHWVKWITYHVMCKLHNCYAPVYSMHCSIFWAQSFMSSGSPFWLLFYCLSMVAFEISFALDWKLVVSREEPSNEHFCSPTCFLQESFSRLLVWITSLFANRCFRCLV